MCYIIGISIIWRVFMGSKQRYCNLFNAVANVIEYLMKV